MSEFAKHYVGLDLTGAEDNGVSMPVSRVTLFVDGEKTVTAGDDTGAELTGRCVHATQGMADAILAQVRGYRYHAFSADDANVDPAAEIGDGVDAAGIYGTIFSVEDDGSGFVSLSSPGRDELDEDYPAEGYMTRQFNLSIASVRSSITKTSEQILLEVAGTYSTKTELSAAEQQLRGAISVSAESIRGEVSKTLEGYATREHVESAVEQSAESITATVARSYATKSEREEGDSQTLSQAQSQIEQSFSRITLSARNESDVTFLEGQRWEISGRGTAETVSVSESSQFDMLPVREDRLPLFEGELTLTVAFEYQVTRQGAGSMDLVTESRFGGSPAPVPILDFGDKAVTDGFVRFTTSIDNPYGALYGGPDAAYIRLVSTPSGGGGEGDAGPTAGVSVAVRNVSMIVRGGQSSITLSYNGLDLSSANVTFNGMVTFRDLSVPGSTVISGSNLHGGTITLGGRDNGSGALEILDANGKKIGAWDSTGISATNGTFSGSLSSATGSISGVTGSFSGSISSGGTFTGTHSSGGISGCTLSNSTGGTFVGTCSGSTLSSCKTGSTSLSFSSGNGSLSSWAGSAALTSSGTIYLVTQSTGHSFRGGLVTIQGGLICTGGISCSGTKPRTMTTAHYGKRQLDAYETPLPTFSDYGTARLDGGGVFHIIIDPVFAETVDESCLPTVFLAKYGEGDIWVEQVEHDLVTVRGTPGLRFSWETRYAQANAGVDRLRVMDFDYQEDDGERDFGADALRAYEHSAENIDYARAGREYFTDYERSLTE